MKAVVLVVLLSTALLAAPLHGAIPRQVGSYSVTFVDDSVINETWRITITEAGQLGNWSETQAGQPFGSVTFVLPNGTYDYATAYQTGNFTVDGKNLTIFVDPFDSGGVGPIPTEIDVSTILTEISVLLGIAFVASIATSLVAVHVRKRRGKKPG